MIAGLENNHCCSLLAPLLSPRLTILKITEHPSYLAETELVKLFQRLPSCSTLQNIQLSAKVRDNIFSQPCCHAFQFYLTSDPGDQPDQRASLHVAAHEPTRVSSQPHSFKLQHTAPITPGGLGHDEDYDHQDNDVNCFNNKTLYIAKLHKVALLLNHDHDIKTLY